NVDDPGSARAQVPDEVDHLLDVVRHLRARGTGIIYISHKLDEIFAVADRLTVLRDGESVATRARGAIDRGELVEVVGGRDLTALYGVRHVSDRCQTGVRPVSDTSLTPGRPALQLSDVSNAERGVRAVSLSVHPGEIVGVAGLVGSGRTELAETIFGLTPLDRGPIRVNGAAARIVTPAHAIPPRLAHVPEGRQRHGRVPNLAVAGENTP